MDAAWELAGIDVEHKNGTVVLTLASHEYETLTTAARAISADDRVRVALFTGSWDTFHRQPASPPVGDDGYGHYEQFSRYVSAFLNIDKPVVVALDSDTQQRGLTLALLADIVVCERGVTFVDSHVEKGVSSASGAYLWPLLTGLNRARRYLLTSDPISADDAYEIGLVTEVVEPGAALARAMEYAGTLAAKPATGIQLTKRALNQWLRVAMPTFKEALALEFLTVPKR